MSSSAEDPWVLLSGSRPLGTSIRVRFAFDPRHMAILLIGDKTDRWSDF
jgi:hypothetical protein